MRPRTREQQARLAELLADGWLVAEELPLLGLVRLVRPRLGDTGAITVESTTIGRRGHNLREDHHARR
mgnify:CR=1 FL=1